MKHISKETKASIINRYNNGESVVELTEATGVARSTIYGWLKADRESAKKPVTKKTVNDLNRAVSQRFEPGCYSIVNADQNFAKSF